MEIKVETLENLCGKVASKFQDRNSSPMHTKFLACTPHTLPEKSSILFRHYLTIFWGVWGVK